MDPIAPADLSNSIIFKAGNKMAMGTWLMQLLHLKDLNDFCTATDQADPAKLLEAILSRLPLNVISQAGELSHIPATGAFIAVANHPLGMLDEWLFLHTVRQVRPNFKLFGSEWAHRMEGLSTCCIAAGDLAGAQAHLADGHPLGIFPAGEVSAFIPQLKTIADKPWKGAPLKLVQQMGVPALSLYIGVKEKWLFHLMGKADSHLRSACLTAKLLGVKEKVPIHLRIGKPLPPTDAALFSNADTLGNYLRAKTYALGSPFNMPKVVLPKLGTPKKAVPVLAAQPVHLLEAEIGRIRGRCLFHREGGMEMYLASAEDIPLLLQEIGRMREITFRAVGEGTNHALDLDTFDLYYRHLFIWDTDKSALVGAYRIGKGKEIMAQYGVRGFYTRSLFRMKKGIYPILADSIELGRSFIVPGYQQRVLSLFMLWKGILFFMLKHPEYRYIIGPVSISNNYSAVSKGLLISFIKKHYYNHEMAKLIKPKKAFAISEKKIKTDDLLSHSQPEPAYLDKLLMEIEPERYRMPVLLKKYMKQNAKIIGFNIDPKFNNALDGLMVLDFKETPAAMVQKLQRELSLD